MRLVAWSRQCRLGTAGAPDFGYAHLFIDEGTSNLPNRDAPTAAPTGTLIGTYKAKVNILSIQYRHSF